MLFPVNNVANGGRLAATKPTLTVYVYLYVTEDIMLAGETLCFFEYFAWNS